MEKRITSRQRVLKAATIEFGRGGISCMVRNMSDRGAMLDVASPVGIPEYFSLIMPTEGKYFSCRVVWWNEKRIGVTFE